MNSASVACVAKANTSKAAAPSAVQTAWRCRRFCDGRIGMNELIEPREDLRDQLALRNRQLQEIAAQLETELFGIDTIIDRVIDSVRAWYVLPELVSRPLIVCLWGLTGAGKT